MEVDDKGKVILLKELVNRLGEIDELHVWFSIPGGLILGKPTTFDDYSNNLFGPKDPDEEPAKPRPDIAKRLKDEQYLFLKNVTIRQGNTENYFNVAMVDAADISAWGFFQPSEAKHGTL